MKKLGLIAVVVGVVAVINAVFSPQIHQVVRIIDGDTVEGSGYAKSIR